MSRSEEIALRKAAKQFWSQMERGGSPASGEGVLRRMAQQVSRLPRLVRSIGLLAASATVALLAVQGMGSSPPRAGQVSASAPLALPPPPQQQQQPSCPPPAPAPIPPEPPHPELSSPDGYSVIDRGFPALLAKGDAVAVVVRGGAGAVAIEILSNQTDGRVERVPIVLPGEFDHARDQPRGSSLASRISTRLGEAHQKLAGFVTMPGTELGLTGDEVLATPTHATTVQVGELAIHHQGQHVSIRRAANPRDITLEWITTELDTTGACVPFLAAAYTANGVLALRFDHARCARPSVHHVFTLGGKPRPSVAWTPDTPHVSIETGSIEGLPAISPDGSTIVVEPLEWDPEGHCELPLLRSSDGKRFGSLPTTADGESCLTRRENPSPAQTARNRELAARLAGWRSLPAVDAESLADRVWIRRGRRLWQIDYSHPEPEPEPEDGRDRCNKYPSLEVSRAWQVSDHSVLLDLSFGAGPDRCDFKDWQVKTLPELGQPARVTP